MKIGVLGVSGRLGSSLLGYPNTIGVDIDITEPLVVKEANLDQFDVVINCAAKTGVDACEHGREKSPGFKEAIKVNSRAVEYIRSNFSGRLIHISTDYVFKCNRGPYDEYANRSPVNDYGYTKWGGEIVLETFPGDGETLIVRTTGLYGGVKGKPDFTDMVRKNLSDNQMLMASRQLMANHTYIPHLCNGLLYASEMPMENQLEHLHIASSDVISRYEFAVMVANVFGLDTQWLHSCKNSEIQGWVAKRPTKGGLKVKRAQKLGVPIYSTLDGLLEFVERRE